jgi:hypothetical protein
MTAQDTKPRTTGWRRISALLGFLQKYEIDLIFRTNPFVPADSSVTPVDLWRTSLEARESLTPLDPAFTMMPLPASLEADAAEVRSRQTYKNIYEVLADYQFGLAPIEALLALQWEADIEYVDELANRIPAVNDERAIFAFAFGESDINEPIISNNQIVFSTHRRDLAAEATPRVRKAETGIYEVIVRVLSRPNYIQVGVLNNRMILLNGVHKTLALYRAGLTHVPCIWRPMNRLQEAGIAVEQTTLFLPQTFDGPRPALLVDFLNEAVASPVLVRSMDSILRVNFTVDRFLSPAPLD